MPEKNRFIKAFRRAIVTISICCLGATMMAGCGKGKEGGNGAGNGNSNLDPEEQIYVAEYIPLEKSNDKEYLDIWGAQIFGDKLFVRKQANSDGGDNFYDEFDITNGKVVSEVKFTGMDDIDPSADIPEKYKETAEYGVSVNNATKLVGGNYAGIITSYWYEESDISSDDSYGTSYYLAMFDKDGKLRKYEPLDLTQFFGNDDSYPYNLYSDINGNIILFCSSWNETVSKYAILKLDQDCNIVDSNVGNQIQQLEDFYTSEDGKNLLIYEDQNWETKVSLFNMDTLNTEKDYQLPPELDGVRCITEDGGKLIMATYEKLMSYDPVAGTADTILKWRDVDIKDSAVRRIAKKGDAFYAVIDDWESNSSDIVKLSIKKRKEANEKYEIVIASLYEDYQLSGKVIEFNKAHTDVHVTIKNYFDWDKKGSSLTDAMSNMINDITGTNPPDLVNLNDLTLGDYVKQGVFEDITPYLEKSESIDLSDYSDSILNCYRFGDLLVAIPRSYYLKTLVVNEDDFGDRHGWTISEMIEYDKAHPAGSITSFTDRIGLMNMCLYYNIDSFINWETGECRFESDEFKELLEYIASYPDEYDYNSITTYDPADEIANGKILSFEASFYNIQSMQQYDDYLFAGKGDFIGYPTLDGSPCSIIQASTCVGICSKSENKDRCWEFIEYLLTDPFTDTDFGMPSNEKEMKKLVDKELSQAGQETNSTISWEDGGTYRFHYATQDEIDELYRILSEARLSTKDTQLMSIIEEETGGFFAGQKSVDECAKIIQSRISLYVQENM